MAPLIVEEDGIQTKWLRKGGLLLLCGSKRLAEYILASEKVRSYFGISCSIHKPRSAKKDSSLNVVVKGVHEKLEKNFLEAEISNKYRVEIKVERFVTKEKKVLRMIKITCPTEMIYDSFLRHGVIIGHEIHRCEAYVERHRKRFCYNCFGFNHLAKDCKKDKVCGKCSQTIGDEAHECKTMECVYCKGEHFSWKCKRLVESDQDRSKQKLKMKDAAVTKSFAPSNFAWVCKDI